MTFALVCLLAVLATVPFGLAFLLAPETIAAPYGISAWNAGTLAVARLFGVSLLNIACAALAVRSTTDGRVQKNVSTWFALASAVATITALHSVTTGGINTLGWSTVAIYGFFTLAWASVALRKNVS